MISYRSGMVPYEIIEHTAEIGIRAFGRTREELFAHAAQGMFALIVPPEAIRSTGSIQVKARLEQPPADPAQADELLLVAWLRELLYIFDTRHFLVRELKIKELAPGRVEAAVSGEDLDLGRHPVEREVKAVTYCDLKVARRTDGIWVAEVIFDI